MMEELRIRTIVIATQRLVVEDAALLRQEVHREKTRNPGILDWAWTKAVQPCRGPVPQKEGQAMKLHEATARPFTGGREKW